MLEDKKSIDVVLLWVDGSDPCWINDFNHYSPNVNTDGVNKNRFRDWDILKFLFRSLEQCCPWIRKIHFVTYGHYPSWLNTEGNNLVLHTHKDIFYNSEHLPVFNASAIELNFLGIPDLAEKFIYFNDDTFVLKEAPEERFFVDDKPVDFLIEALPRRGWLHDKLRKKDTWHSMINNCLDLINADFDKKQLVHSAPELFFNQNYGRVNISTNYLFSLFNNYIYFKHFHFSQPYCKRTLQDAFERYQKTILSTSASKFRQHDNLSQAIYRYLHLAKGDFYPMHYDDYKCYSIKDINSAEECAQNMDKYTLVCLNDDFFSTKDEEFEKIKSILHQKLVEIFPNKSVYEKQ